MNIVKQHNFFFKKNLILLGFFLNVCLQNYYYYFN